MAKPDLFGVWLLEAFERGGVDTDQLEQKCPEEFNNLITNPRTASPGDLNTVLVNCAHLSEDNSFGLHLPNYVDTVMLGTLGFLQWNAPTVRHLMGFTVEYFQTLYLDASFEFSINENMGTIEFRMDSPFNSSCRHQNEWSLGFFADFISKKRGCRWHPIRTEFMNDAPDNIADLVEIFGGDISFNSDRTAFEFGVEELDFTLNKTDPHLLEILTDRAETLMAEVGHLNSFVSMTRLLILEGLELGNANSSHIARMLDMSRSTFKRRLAKEGGSFRALRKEIIRQVAVDALKNTEVEVGEVAAKLGYSELSAFDRAFKKMVGVSPGGYRRSTKRES